MIPILSIAAKFSSLAIAAVVCLMIDAGAAVAQPPAACDSGTCPRVQAAGQFVGQSILVNGPPPTVAYQQMPPAETVLVKGQPIRNIGKRLKKAVKR